MGIRKRLLSIFVVYFGHKKGTPYVLCHSALWTFHGVFLSQLSNKFGKVPRDTYPKGPRSTIGL